MHSLLTKREKEIFHLLTLNKSTKDIAQDLSISEKQFAIIFLMLFKS